MSNANNERNKGPRRIVNVHCPKHTAFFRVIGSLHQSVSHCFILTNTSTSTLYINIYPLDLPSKPLTT